MTTNASNRRRGPLIVLISGFTVLVLGACWFLVGKGPHHSHSDRVNLKLDASSTLGSIPANFIGIGYETSAAALPGYFNNKNRPLVELYRTLGTTGLIRIGGNISDHTKYAQDGKAE